MSRCQSLAGVSIPSVVASFVFSVTSNLWAYRPATCMQGRFPCVDRRSLPLPLSAIRTRCIDHAVLPSAFSVAMQRCTVTYLNVSHTFIAFVLVLCLLDCDCFSCRDQFTCPLCWWGSCFLSSLLVLCWCDQWMWWWGSSWHLSGPLHCGQSHFALLTPSVFLVSFLIGSIVWRLKIAEGCPKVGWY